MYFQGRLDKRMSGKKKVPAGRPRSLRGQGQNEKQQTEQQREGAKMQLGVRAQIKKKRQDMNRRCPRAGESRREYNTASLEVTS